MSDTEFVYVTYIRTTPEQLWRALTEPAFTFRYWGAGLVSDWRVGSPVLWQPGPDAEPVDHDQVVLVSEPHRRLAYTWHNYQPEHAELFGWSEERLAELQREPRSKVTFEIEPAGEIVKLTVVHDDLVAGGEMLRALSGQRPETGGWPEILAGLKTLLETGDSPESWSMAKAAAG